MEDIREGNAMGKIARFIVDKRNGIYIAFFVAVLYCASSISKVTVNNDLTVYLPDYTETRQGLDLMEEQFTTYGTAQIMITNITLNQAKEIADYIENIDGVASVDFADLEKDTEEEIEEYYKNASALLSIVFDGETDDAVSIAAMKEIKAYISDYDTYINSEVDFDESAQLQEEMKSIMIIAVLVILGVLTLTSQSYAEIIVYLIVFAVAAVLNMGTNYIFGEISFVTNAIAVILQLRLAIDYAIIFCHRFSEERETKEVREATIDALSKAIVEISSSSLTTISGLLALTLMQYKIGMDMGLILTKGILCSLITVFLLMPGLLMLFNKPIEKTRHKNLLPKIDGWGRIILKLRYVLPCVFIVVIVGAYVLSGKCEYVFSMNAIDTNNPPEDRIAYDKISELFGIDNTIAVLVPKGNYEKERVVLNNIEALAEINSATGIANIEISPNEDSDTKYFLAESMTPRRFAEMAEVEIEISRLLYSAYAIDNEEYGALMGDIDDYNLPLLDIFLFLGEQNEKGTINIDDDEKSKDIDDAYEELKKAEAQLQGDDFARLILSSKLPEESAESFELLETIRAIAANEYGDNVLIVGNTTSARDLSVSFAFDNKLITVLTALFVMVVLMFTFKSAGLPLLLILTIQGSIWINFSFPYILGTNMFFIAYLIVSSIQMGATIDYAIVITNRYMTLKAESDKKEAIINALSQGFPTVFTSGTILSTAGFLIYYLSTSSTVRSIGLALGRGTLISMILVMTVLPQLLVLFDSIIERTAFTLNKDLRQTINKDLLQLDGHVKGYISGYVDADLKGVLKGSINAEIESYIQNEVPEVCDNV